MASRCYKCNHIAESDDILCYDCQGSDDDDDFRELTCRCTICKELHGGCEREGRRGEIDNLCYTCMHGPCMILDERIELLCHNMKSSYRSAVKQVLQHDNVEEDEVLCNAMKKIEITPVGNVAACKCLFCKDNFGYCIREGNPTKLYNMCQSCEYGWCGERMQELIEALKTVETIAEAKKIVLDNAPFTCPCDVCRERGVACSNDMVPGALLGHCYDCSYGECNDIIYDVFDLMDEFDIEYDDAFDQVMYQELPPLSPQPSYQAPDISQYVVGQIGQVEQKDEGADYDLDEMPDDPDAEPSMLGNSSYARAA